MQPPLLSFSGDICFSLHRAQYMCIKSKERDEGIFHSCVLKGKVVGKSKPLFAAYIEADDTLISGILHMWLPSSIE